MLCIEDICFKNLMNYWESIATNAIYNDKYICFNTGTKLPLLNPIFLKETAEIEELLNINNISSHSLWHHSKYNNKILLEKL